MPAPCSPHHESDRPTLCKSKICLSPLWREPTNSWTDLLLLVWVTRWCPQLRQIRTKKKGSPSSGNLTTKCTGEERPCLYSEDKSREHSTQYRWDEMFCHRRPAVQDCADLWPRIIPNPNTTASFWFSCVFCKIYLLRSLFQKNGGRADLIPG